MINQGQQQVEVTITQVITDIVFDAELDAALFSLEPPAGYHFRTVSPITINATEAERAGPDRRASAQRQSCRMANSPTISSTCRRSCACTKRARTARPSSP